jgi:hypothetical protein
MRRFGLASVSLAVGGAMLLACPLTPLGCVPGSGWLSVCFGQPPAPGQSVPIPPPPASGQDAFPNLHYEPPPPPPGPPNPPDTPIVPPDVVEPVPEVALPPDTLLGPAGFFASVDLAVLYPSVKNHLAATVHLPIGRAVRFTLPASDLGETVSPRFEVGYLLPDNLGFFAVNYRFVSAEGSEPFVLKGGPFQVESRLDINTFDFDYGLAPYLFAPRWELHSRIGVRLTNVFFDSRIDNGNFYEQIGNNFYGAGPHVRLELQRRLVLPGLALFGQVDGGLLVGQVRQHFTEEGFPSRRRVSDICFLFRETETVPVLGAQVGVMYTPVSLSNLHLRLGYQYEHYFEVGDLESTVTGATASSSGEVATQGVFVQVLVDF